jgi:hypothetical protein
VLKKKNIEQTDYTKNRGENNSLKELKNNLEKFFLKTKHLNGCDVIFHYVLFYNNLILGRFR